MVCLLPLRGSIVTVAGLLVSAAIPITVIACVPLVNAHDAAICLHLLTDDDRSVSNADQPAADGDLVTDRRLLTAQLIRIAEIDRHTLAAVGFQQDDQTLLIRPANIDALGFDDFPGYSTATGLLAHLLPRLLISAALCPLAIVIAALPVAHLLLPSFLTLALFSSRLVLISLTLLSSPILLLTISRLVVVLGISWLASKHSY